MITIYHNPRCSKSREAMERVQQFAQGQNVDITVIDYLKAPPTLEQLQALQQRLGVPAREMVRDGEPEYTELNLASADDAALLQAVASHPRLLQRPIIEYRGKAVIGRPPERLDALLRPD